jgi:hypothetical protein
LLAELPPLYKGGTGGISIASKIPLNPPFKKGGLFNTVFAYIVSMNNISMFPESSNSGESPGKAEGLPMTIIHIEDPVIHCTMTKKMLKCQISLSRLHTFLGTVFNCRPHAVSPNIDNLAKKS